MRFVLLFLFALAAPLRAADDVKDHYLVPKRRALVVGVGNNKDYGTLRYAVSDARKIRDLLEEQLNFEVVFLHDAPRAQGEPQWDYEQRLPTGDRIVATFRDLVDRSRDADQFFFYFSGHGEGRADGDVLLPMDLVEGSADLFAIPIRGLIVEGLRGMRNAMVMIDACRTGDESSFFGQELAALEDRPEFPVLLSCAPRKVSFETQSAGGGAFTRAVLDGFEVGRAVGGSLSFSSLLKEVQDRIGQYVPRGETQEPLVPGKVFDAEGNYTGPDLLFEFRLDEDTRASIADVLGPDQEGFLEAVRDPVMGWRTQAVEEICACLWREGEFDLAVRLLERIDEDISFDAGAEREQPFLLNLAQLYRIVGDARKLAETLARIREEVPGTTEALLAAVVDDTGALDRFTRAEAARALLAESDDLPPATRLEMVDLLALAGDFVTAADVGRELLALVPEEDVRARAYLRATVAAQEGEVRDALARFQAGRGQPGRFPGDHAFYAAEYGLLRLLGDHAAALNCAGEAAETLPDLGFWRLAIAQSLRRIAETNRKLTLPQQIELYDDAFEHVRAALAIGLLPDDLLAAMSLAGARALELGELLDDYVERYPRAWQPALVKAFASQQELGDEYREAVRVAAEDLSPSASMVYRRIVRLTYEGIEEEILRVQAHTDPDGPVDPRLLNHFSGSMRLLYERFYEYVDSLGSDPDAWEVFQRLCRAASDEEGFVRLFEAEHGERIDRRDLPLPLVHPAAYSYLATGRLERFRQLRECIPFPCDAADDMAWAEVVYLLAMGEDEQARTILAQGLRTPSSDMHGTPEAALALLAVRSGEISTAREHLAQLVSIKGPYCFPLVLLTLHGLGELEEDSPLWSLFDWVSADGADAAYVAALRHHSDPSWLRTWAALHPRSPFTREMTFADEPGRSAFKGSYAYHVAHYTEEGPEFAVDGWTLYLNQGRNGVMEGSFTDEREGGSAGRLEVAGEVDAHGNFQGTITMDEAQLPIFAKLHPITQLEADETIVEAIVVVDPDGARVDLRGAYVPEED